MSPGFQNLGYQRPSLCAYRGFHRAAREKVVVWSSSSSRPASVTGQRALFFGAWSLWFFVFLMMPISTMYYGTVESSMLFVSANIALWLGLLLPFHSMRGSQVSVPRRFAERDIGRILASLVAAGALAIPAKLIDLIVYRDILSATSVADARSKIEANGFEIWFPHFILDYRRQS